MTARLMQAFEVVRPEPNQYSPNYSIAFRFENEHDYRVTAGWMRDNWQTSFYWSALYVLFVLIGPIYMSTRDSPFRLKGPLAVWNVMLATFSIIGVIRMTPEMVHVLRTFGFHHSACANTFHREVPISSFWTWLFIMSKAPELIDTVFVVLRKQRLIFLHWYHHASVLIFTWYAYADEASTGRWYSTMNYAVHAVMYSYYALRAVGVRIPRSLAMSITIAQIAQMIMGTYVTVYAYVVKSRGDSCDISYSTLYAGIAIYISYFVLFAQFFAASYFGAGRRGGGAKDESKSKSKSKKVQ